MTLFVVLICLLAIPAFLRARWAYVAFVLLGLLYFPASTAFRLDPKPCELSMDLSVAAHSLSNHSHIILFFIFFLLTARQFRASGWQSAAWAVGLTMAMGVAVEIAEGLTGTHHCKASDLIPDFLGALLGVVTIALFGAIGSATPQQSHQRRPNG